jgi:hypothetical protein
MNGRRHGTVIAFALVALLLAACVIQPLPQPEAAPSEEEVA